MAITNKNLRIYEAIAHEDAMAASEQRELTPDLRRESKRIFESMRARVLDKERADKARAASTKRVRPSILEMARDALLSRLGKLLEANPGAVFAHRDFAEMTDHDLRTALEDAESFVERLA